MYEVIADIQNLKLYVTLRQLDGTGIKEMVQNIEQECYKLLPGFTCLIVLPKGRLLKQMDLDILMNIEDLIHAYGASKLIRV
ncbi:hypothetical protein ACFL03_16465, partial [Thermodesulfobacteriota bacterium]